MTNAVVLAAGLGSRLSHLTTQQPKALLEIGPGETILARCARGLAGAGVTNLVVVAGYRAPQIQTAAAQIQADLGLGVRVLETRLFRRYNNAYSLWLAMPFLAGGGFVVDGDLVQSGGLEQHILASRGTADMVLGIDRSRVLTDEAMRVGVRSDGTVKAIAKQLEPAAAHAESTGMQYVEPHAVAGLTIALEQTWGYRPDAYYEDCYSRFIEQGNIIVTRPIHGVDWVEVDDPDDLRTARAIAAGWTGSPRRPTREAAT